MAAPAAKYWEGFPVGAKPLKKSGDLGVTPPEIFFGPRPLLSLRQKLNYLISGETTLKITLFYTNL